MQNTCTEIVYSMGVKGHHLKKDILVARNYLIEISLTSKKSYKEHEPSLILNITKTNNFLLLPVMGFKVVTSLSMDVPWL